MTWSPPCSTPVGDEGTVGTHTEIETEKKKELITTF